VTKGKRHAWLWPFLWEKRSQAMIDAATATTDLEDFSVAAELAAAYAA
jgi:hypothetical protein